MPWSADEIDVSFWKVELINGTCDNSTLHYAPSPIDNDLYNNTSCCIEGGIKYADLIVLTCIK